MTLHQLRRAVGDDDFFRILRVWAQSRAGEHVRTAEFIRLAERISGQDLDGLFQTWLYTPGRPELAAAGVDDRAERRADRIPPAARATMQMTRVNAAAER
jgi:aminopeptidase N